MDCIFVFPTKIAADTWAEKLLDFVPAFAMERFIAWDTFKGDAIRSRQQNKTSIPSILRKIYAQFLIQKNNSLVQDGKPLLTTLINPDFAQESDSFADWIASLLPVLNLWKKAYDSATKEGDFFSDQTDADLLTLYTEYKNFLESHNLFDPAWEEPPFDDKGFKYIIFYPEVLSDFCEYENLLRNNSHITIIPVAEKAERLPPPECKFYSNSRTELRETALFIRQLVKQKKCNYSDIVISVPNMDALGAYVMRELKLFCIPAVLRSGRSLSEYGAGRFFRQVQECYDTNFAFDALKELLLNKNLPWKDTEAIDQLIQFGIDNSCICSYEQDGQSFDIWKESFKTDKRSERAETLYNAIKTNCKAICLASSFEKLQSAYFQFKNALFNESAFSDESNLVLGRCLSELANLIDIEKSFNDIPIEQHFSFFESVISDTEYLAQNKTLGVSVVPYKLAASVPAYCHIILDASQDNISVLYKQLGFLPQSKRLGLKLLDTEPSAFFVELYRRHSFHQVQFSCSEKSFSGYGIPHYSLVAKKCDLVLPESEATCHEEDFISSEIIAIKNKSFQTPNKNLRLSSWQQMGFENWCLTVDTEQKQVFSLQDETLLKDSIEKTIASKKHEGFFSVDQTDLSDYFTCPRHWIFKNVLRLKEPATRVQLMQDTWQGTIYHDIIRRYLEYYKNNELPLDSPQFISTGKTVLSSDNQSRLWECVNFALEQYRASCITKQLLETQKKAYYLTAEAFLVFFSQEFSGCRVNALEKEISFQPDWLKALYPDVILNGKIDCVLIDTEDNDIIIDFKKNKTPSINDCGVGKDGLIKDFQIPMYVTLWEKGSRVSFVKNACFMSIQQCNRTNIVGQSLGRIKSIPRFSTEEINGFENILDVFSSKVEQFIQEIKTQNFAQLKNVTYQICQECKWKKLCRTTYNISGEKI
ncbi:MAG: PD-(D/E)XK nuclease family protein [Spirochaetaceae bacterium]|nr:PD-(D/E)XK nuclease family protein [Spirochaetaceae bacterium]